MVAQKVFMQYAGFCVTYIKEYSTFFLENHLENSLNTAGIMYLLDLVLIFFLPNSLVF